MSAHQDGFGLVYPGSDIRRPPVVGMKFLHERAMRPRDLFTRGALRKPQDLIGLILGHRPREALSRAIPTSSRVVVALACRTPSGKPAVEISL